MEQLPKVVYGCPEKTINLNRVEDKEKTSANCNICRNFKNIHDWKHRMSKFHQNKLTERFRIIRSKMKINIDSVTVHDEEWGNKEEYYCYFCDKPVKKHGCDSGFTIEFLGLMKHQSDLNHRHSVKAYLKYHRRNENCDIFCKSKDDLEKFMANIPDAKKKHTRKLEILNEKDVKHIRETEVERQKLVKEATQGTVIAEFNKNKCDGNDKIVMKTTQKIQKNKMQPNEKIKIPPWLVDKPANISNDNESNNIPVIGPTMETLVKHVASQEKKGLPSKRILGNMKHNKISNTKKWFPSFSGVWSKGRHRNVKSNSKKK